MTKFTTDYFIERAMKIHGDKYHYSKVNYITSTTKVIITCNKCNNEFVQTPSSHLQENGCPVCGIHKQKTSEKFIEDAKIVHGNKYKYDKVKYLSFGKKVVIICSKPGHGDFEQTPSAHLKEHGCPDCGGTKKKTTEGFIEDAKIVHKDKYDYSKVDYKGDNIKVIITCSKPGHGDFEQIPSSHLQTHGCPVCGNSMKKTTQEFVNKAIEKHGDKYNYDKVNYINCNQEVTITCNNCKNDFNQKPTYHLQRRGCYCGTSFVKKTTEKFIEEAKKVPRKDGVMYIYDKVHYINDKSKVTITCPICNKDFEQTPGNHLQGKGCKCCGRKRNNNVNKLTTEEFIKKANLKHENRYTYDKVIFLGSKTKVQITCRHHGDFPQNPYNHLSRNGCKKCNLSKGALAVETVLKKLNLDYELEYTFEDCVYKSKLPFDFAVFFYGTIGLIEFHGEQHYKPVNFGGSNCNFEVNKERDKIKEDYAFKNNIELLIIPFDQISNAEKLVIEFIQMIF